MSYARFSDESDVYVYEDSTHGLVCCMCILTSKWFIAGNDYQALLTHLAEHRAAGHLVPDDAITQLQREQAGESFDL
jgi:hypothetical protein